MQFFIVNETQSSSYHTMAQSHNGTTPCDKMNLANFLKSKEVFFTQGFFKGFCDVAEVTINHYII
jgi:hypothetical protein